MPESTEPLPLENFETLVQHSFSSTVEVCSTTWKYLTAPGENFGSLILGIEATVKIKEKTQTLHMVCKMPQGSEFLFNLFNTPVAFYKELYFYETIVPLLLQFQKDCSIEDSRLTSVVPNFYGGRLSSNEMEKFDKQAAILLENLNYSGYSTKDRIEGMDRDHMAFGVQKLAKFHALVVAYKIKNPNEFKEKVSPGLVQCENETAMKCLVGMIGKAVDSLKIMKEAQPFMHAIEKTLEYELEENKKPRNELWCTILHNDFWVNNAMYCYEGSNNNQIKDLKMVDFQLTSYDYGVKDLIFFLISSAKAKVIDNHLDELITLYYESFVDCLQLLKTDTNDFTKESFDQILTKSAPTKFAQCIMMVQVIKSPRGSAPDVNSVKDEQDFLSIGKGKIFEDKLLHVLLTFAKKGWLIK